MNSRKRAIGRIQWDLASRNERLKAVSLAVGGWQSAEAGIKLLQTTQPFEQDSFLYRLLMTGVAVTYARPFGANDGIASLPRELQRFDDVELRAQHNELLLTRRKLYGHTDGNYRWDVESLPFGTQISFRRNSEGIPEIVPVVPTPDISPSSLPTIARLVETQILKVLDLMANLVKPMLIPGRIYEIGKTCTVDKDFP